MVEVRLRELRERFTTLDEATSEAEAAVPGQQGAAGLTILRELLG